MRAYVRGLGPQCDYSDHNDHISDQSEALIRPHGMPTFLDISPTPSPPLQSYSPTLSESQISQLQQ